MSVQFPGSAYAPDQLDLGEPIQELLRDVHVLEGPRTGPDGKPLPEQSAILGTPPSMQLITAGATALSKGWAVVLGLGGSAAGVLTAVRSTSQTDPVLVISTALLAAAGLIAAALVVRGDVSARAQAAAAEYAARAAIVNSFISNCYVGRPKAERTSYWLREDDGNGRISVDWKPVERMERENGELIAVLAGQRGRVPAARIAEWQSRP
ncbi:hypothetical protein [Blastococcus sp. LR1]|uniref:hypothetical protein n=1 Tax=Blastococcus sp. LR1 TaxID=2877000 RepID=UPI001CCAED0F|nr:hypothetical protein [Blastococcus sp. LR1]MCA0144282.1 hypothetical protein [Blastococcus sp. LR1]